MDKVFRGRAFVKYSFRDKYDQTLFPLAGLAFPPVRKPLNSRDNMNRNAKTHMHYDELIDSWHPIRKIPQTPNKAVITKARKETKTYFSRLNMSISAKPGYDPDVYYHKIPIEKGRA